MARSWFAPILVLLRALDEHDAVPPRGLQTTPEENGLAAGLVVLSVALLEAVLSRVRYVRGELRGPMEAEDGTLVARSRGTPQGGVVSPLLANLFLHYVLDVCSGPWRAVLASGSRTKSSGMDS